VVSIREHTELQYMLVIVERLVKKSIHVTENYYIWQEGGSTEVMKKKKVSGCRFFPFRHPLGYMTRIYCLLKLSPRK
jgi:hypothetical protein